VLAPPDSSFYFLRLRLTRTLTALQLRTGITAEQQQEGMEWLAGVLAPEFLIGDSQGGAISVEAALAELRERGVVCSYAGQCNGNPRHGFHVAGVSCATAQNVARALVLQVGGLISWQLPCCLCRWPGTCSHVCSVHLRNHTHTTPATTILRTLQPRPNPAREQLQAEKLWELAAKLVAKYDVGTPPAGLSQQEHAYAMLQGEGVRLACVSASGRAHFMHSSSSNKISLSTTADILGLKVRQAGCALRL